MTSKIVHFVSQMLMTALMFFLGRDEDDDKRTSGGAESNSSDEEPERDSRQLKLAIVWAERQKRERKGFNANFKLWGNARKITPARSV